MSDYSVGDFIRNNVFSLCVNSFSMLLEAGVPLPTVAKFAGEIQGSIHRALHVAAQRATLEITGQPPVAPTFGKTFLDELMGDEGPHQPPEGGPTPEGPPDPKNPFA